MTERRSAHRREEDVETHEIVEHAVADAPLVHRLIRTGKVAAAVGMCCTLIGGASGALGYKLVGPREQNATEIGKIKTQADSNAARIARGTVRSDSIFELFSQMSERIETIAFIQCVQLRQDHPELRPRGCDAATAGQTPRGHAP